MTLVGIGSRIMRDVGRDWIRDNAYFGIKII